MYSSTRESLSPVGIHFSSLDHVCVIGTYMRQNTCEYEHWTEGPENLHGRLAKHDFKHFKTWKTSFPLGPFDEK